MDDELLVQIDELVECGEVESRSQAVRSALEKMLDERRGKLVAEATIEAYCRIPQTEDELRWADAGAREMIAEEPWERW
ncbi:MAG: hypothetical protein F4138_02300 [Acidimicrobiia bacterium]|nr:hypothetical protein [Acidimicrobiia bacterium]